MKKAIAATSLALFASLSIMACEPVEDKDAAASETAASISQAVFEPTTAPATVAPTPVRPAPSQTAEVPVTDAESSEELYLSLLEMSDVYMPNKATEDAAVEAGWAMCNAFDNPTVTYGMILEGGLSAQTVYNQADVENIIYSAAMSLCPEHLDRLPE